MIRGKKSWHYSAAACALAAFAPIASNAMMITACGPNVCYDYDDAQPAALVAEMGLPTLVGDDMIWFPVSFEATSLNGAGTDQETANFVFTKVYTVNQANEIASLFLYEEFDYEIIAPNGGGDVRAAAFMQAQSLNAGCTLPTQDRVSQTVNWNPDGGTQGVQGDTGGMQIGNLSLTLTPAASYNCGLANNMGVSIQDTLTAITTTSPPGQQKAFIQKKFTLVANVPVPAAVWLFGSSLALLGWIRRKP